MITLSKDSFVLDKFAVSTSALCAIHCLFLPIIISVFPAIGSTIFGQESFHMWLLICVIPLSLVALSMGCKQHKSWLVAILGFIGIGILIFAAVYGHELLGHDGERIATLIGVSVIALGHFLNYKFCRHVSCEH
ncbi:MAG: MerC domain-containing protein [Gammaproteobacteria bacterium]